MVYKNKMFVKLNLKSIDLPQIHVSTYIQTQGVSYTVRLKRALKNQIVNKRGGKTIENQ